jgi:hypothetical protein
MRPSTNIQTHAGRFTASKSIFCLHKFHANRNVMVSLTKSLGKV